MTPHSLLLASAVLIILLAIPLWIRRVPRNRFYGVRTPATMADETLWYDVNASCGRDLLVAGVLVLVGIAAVESVGAAWPPRLRDAASAGILILLLAVVSLRAVRNAR
ncbi:MAG: hypothetical protein JWL95_2023 [Gemmatimonadetes bacterium]|nr:hypothetical protein [Gemmatimonadota bacterium]